MKSWPRFVSGVLALVSVPALSGCSDTIAALLGPEEGWARISGQIRDDTRLVVPGVTVSLPYGQGLAYSDVTDKDGEFTFDALASDFAGVSPVAVVVFKDRYLPRTYYYESILDGDELELKPDASQAIRALAPNEFVPTEAHNLWHIGDDDFSGSSNSQMQMASVGVNRGYFITQWNATTRAQYRSATITLVARGIDTARDFNCPNRFGLYIENGTTSYTAPPNSDAGGGFSAYTLTVSLPANFADGRLMFAAISGACSGGAGYDDFEFAEVMVKLNP